MAAIIGWTVAVVVVTGGMAFLRRDFQRRISIDETVKDLPPGRYYVPGDGSPIPPQPCRSTFPRRQLDRMGRFLSALGEQSNR
jgi:hypothetical protein